MIETGVGAGPGLGPGLRVDIHLKEEVVADLVLLEGLAVPVGDGPMVQVGVVETLLRNTLTALSTPVRNISTGLWLGLTTLQLSWVTSMHRGISGKKWIHR